MKRGGIITSALGNGSGKASQRKRHLCPNEKDSQELEDEQKLGEREARSRQREQSSLVNFISHALKAISDASKALNSMVSPRTDG